MTQGAGTGVEVVVEDKGIGISASDAEHIFEPFYRVQAVRDRQIRGVGLGLYLVKRLMEGMGGRVSVRSVPGSGSAFSLYFPRAEGVAAEESVAEKLSQQHGGTA
jgi:two-component system phosphate regulon sensor histidine kinase PhoR